jgi:hypothetical protein
VLAHELGHFLTARWLGFGGARLNATVVTGGASLGTSPDWMVALQSGAGPTVTLLLILLAWLRLRLGFAPWAVALAATAPLRFFVDLVFLTTRLWLTVQGIAPGRPNFDEYNFARAAVWLWKVLRRRRLLLVPLVLGVFAGLAFWFQVAAAPIVGIVNSL